MQLASHALKTKVVNKTITTGELLYILDGMTAELISPIGRGVASISSMLRIIRLHDASASLFRHAKVIAQNFRIDN